MSFFAALRSSAPDCGVFQFRLPMLMPLLTRGRLRLAGRARLEASQKQHDRRSLDNRSICNSFNCLLFGPASWSEA